MVQGLPCKWGLGKPSHGHQFWIWKGTSLSEKADMADNPPKATAKRGAVALSSLLGALGVSSCCLLPLLFMASGVGGAWMGRLTGLSAYQPYFLTATVLLLGVGYRMVRRRAANAKSPEAGAACETNAACTTKPVSQRMMKISLGLATILVGISVLLSVLEWLT